MNRQSTSTYMLKLHNGDWVHRTEYDQVIDAVQTFLPSMLPGHSYSVETMVGQALWSKRLRRRAGAIVAHAVRCRQLPLRFAYNGKRATKLYELDV